MDRRGGPQDAHQEHRLSEYHGGRKTGASRLSGGATGSRWRRGRAGPTT
jgi:hypothetical protein